MLFNLYSFETLFETLTILIQVLGFAYIVFIEIDSHRKYNSKQESENESYSKLGFTQELDLFLLYSAN